MATATPAVSGLRGRAALGFVATVARNGARVGVALAATPLLLRGLGPERYGIYVITLQVVTCLVLLDLRTAGTLKFLLATAPDIDDAERRRLLGAAALLWSVSIPLVAGGAVAAALVLPSTSGVPEILRAEAGVALLLLTAAMALDRVSSLPSQALRGANLDHRGAGPEVLALLIGGVAPAVAALLGGNLVVVAATFLITMVPVAAIRWRVASRHLPWLGIARPHRREVKLLATTGSWLLLGDIGDVALLSTELLVVGSIAGPVAAATYAATSLLIKSVGGPLVELLAAGGPGLAALGATGNIRRLLDARRELLVLATGALATVATAVAALDRAFVSVWLGRDVVGGAGLVACLVLATCLAVLYRTDGVVADTQLAFKPRAIAGVASGAVGIVLGILLGSAYGLAGVAGGFALGRMPLLVVTPLLLSRRLGVQVGALVRPLVRPALAATGAVSLGVVGDRWSDAMPIWALPPLWVAWAAAGFAIWWVAGLSRRDRASVVTTVGGSVSHVASRLRAVRPSARMAP